MPFDKSPDLDLPENFTVNTPGFSLVAAQGNNGIDTTLQRTGTDDPGLIRVGRDLGRYRHLARKHYAWLFRCPRGASETSRECPQPGYR